MPFYGHPALDAGSQKIPSRRSGRDSPVKPENDDIKKTGRYDRNQLKNHLKRGGEFETARSQPDLFNILGQLPKMRSYFLLEEFRYSADNLLLARVILNELNKNASAKKKVFVINQKMNREKGLK